MKTGPRANSANRCASLRPCSMLIGTLSLLLARQFATSAEPDTGSSEQTNSIVASVPAVEPGNGTKSDPEISQEDFRVRVQTNAPPAVGGLTNAAALPEEGFHWTASWRGWGGLHLGLSKTTHLKSPREMLGLPPLTNRPTLH